MEVIGTIKKIGETKAYGSNGFQKREVVITTEETYPQFLNIEFVQDKCTLLDPFSEGQRVKISINLRGREWTNPEGEVKYFNSIQGWRIDAENQSQPITPEFPTLEDTDRKSGNHSEQEDDLPF